MVCSREIGTMGTVLQTNAISKKYITIACCAWASHFMSLWGGFFFDDSEAIVHNQDIQSRRPWQSAFANDFWGTSITHPSSHKSYRPLTVLSYRLNVFFSGGRLDAFQFHTVNVVLHGILSLMALPLFECLLKRKKPRKTLHILDDPAFTGALLFASHPVHTEAVASLVGRADLLAAILFFGLIILYKNVSGLLGWFVSVSLISGTAVLCKETAITVLGVCIIYEVYLRKKPSKFWSETFEKTFLMRVGLLVLIGFIIMILRLKVMNFEGPTFSPTDNPASFHERLTVRVLSYNYIYCLNALLLVWPQWLCFDWSMGCVPLIQQRSDLRIFAVLAFWLIVIAVSYRLVKDLITKDKVDVYVMALSLMLIPFLPSSNLLLRVGFVIAERTLLVPSTGYCLLVAVGLEKLKSRFGSVKNLFTAMYILLLVTFVARSIQRNYEWINEVRLFKSALEVCPLNAKVHYNIGKVLSNPTRGSLRDAERSYRHALELYPRYEQAMNNLANILREKGQLEEAEYWLQLAVAVRPNFAAGWMNLAIVLGSQEERWGEAVRAYKNALAHRKEYPDAQYNLGNLYLDMGDHLAALDCWKKAAALRPTHAAAWGNSMALLDSKGMASAAVELGQEALKHVPKSAAVHFALGNVMGKLNRLLEAERHFRDAIKYDSKNSLYYSNLGVLYHRWRRLEDAEKMYLKALLLETEAHPATTARQQLLRLQNQRLQTKKLV
uniref:dolichyl-phosphate-mannose--protein mannosyltransferase n=3 Tax=Dendroctonus ponderosae TaxID=77166 RepID=A0AAR5NY72_DENPD